MLPLSLNERAEKLCRQMEQNAAQLKINVSKNSSGATMIDCGVAATGGLAAGLAMAEICMSGLARITVVPTESDLWSGPSIQVMTDHPVAACMASQYAGWKIEAEKYFAMGSGPMRAAARQEAILEKIGYSEQPQSAVGVLETSKAPPEAVYKHIARACGISSENLTLLIARTASQAGTVQVVARALETALHKLSELGFDLSKIESGYGLAPLPPVAADDLTGIGRTNDAILYGGQVMLWVRAEDAEIEAIGPKVPASTSADYGEPFADIFARYNHDFYAIDSHLFSPAVVIFSNLTTGRTFRYGHLLPRVIHRSFMP